MTKQDLIRNKENAAKKFLAKVVFPTLCEPVKAIRIINECFRYFNLDNHIL